MAMENPTLRWRVVSDAITIQLGNGDGTFTATPASTVKSLGQTLVTADVKWGWAS